MRAMGVIDPTCAVSHRLSLDQAAQTSVMFETREAVKIVLTP